MPDPQFLAQVALSGFMVGLLFALVAVGLTLIYGMMDLVNFAHGEMLVVGLYTTYWISQLFDIDPLWTLPACAIISGLLGILVHKFLIRHVLRAPMVAQMFSTFGLSVFIISTTQFLWGPIYRSTTPGILAGRIDFFGLLIGRAQFASGMIAFLGFAFVYFLLTKTEIGRALQATAQDRDVAALMGIDTEVMFSLTWAIAGACAGVAGGLLANTYAAYPNAGFIWAMAGYVVVVLGGFGSIPGALVGAIIVGLVQIFSGVFIGSRYKFMIIYLLFLLVLFIRPQGLFGKR